MWTYNYDILCRFIISTLANKIMANLGKFKSKFCIISNKHNSAKNHCIFIFEKAFCAFGKFQSLSSFSSNFDNFILDKLKKSYRNLWSLKLKVKDPALRCKQRKVSMIFSTSDVTQQNHIKNVYFDDQGLLSRRFINTDCMYMQFSFFNTQNKLQMRPYNLYMVYFEYCWVLSAVLL